MAEREKVRESLLGIALVYRFGNPSNKPWSEHERNTCTVAKKQEEEKIRFHHASEARDFFERCGVSVKNDVCPSKLEERLIERTIDIILEKQKRILRGSKEQLFFHPGGVNNKEIYLVSTQSCKRMIQQAGKPFAEESGGTRVAWAVDGKDIFKKGTSVKIDQSSLAHTSGGSCMPDAMDIGHSQNIDNPANAPFMELLHLLEDRFRPFLVNNNADDSKMFHYNDESHIMMCLQLILGEAGKGKGERGYHQDMWATTGAAIIGVSLINGRAMTMKHCGVTSTFSLPRRSAYIMSGAARYGSLWRELDGEFHHRLHPFAKEVAAAYSHEGDDDDTATTRRNAGSANGSATRSLKRDRSPE